MSSSFLISGVYFAFVAVFVIATPDARQRKIGPIIGISVWGVMVIGMGCFGLTLATGK